MKLTPNNIIHHELIGLDARVVESTNMSLVGIEGKIIDETKNMLIIETCEKERRIPKSCSSFVFTVSNSKVKVDGKLLLSQPENRIQTKFRKKFRRVQ